MARWIEVWGFGEAGWMMATSPLTTFLGYPGTAGMFCLDTQWRNRDGLFWSRGLLDRGHCLPRCCVYDYEYDERSLARTNKDSDRGVATGSSFSPPPCLCRPDTQIPGALVSPIPPPEWRQGPSVVRLPWRVAPVRPGAGRYLAAPYPAPYPVRQPVKRHPVKRHRHASVPESH